MTYDQATSPWMREEIDYEALPPERRDNIDIVASAYASVLSPISYLTMPVTTGRRFYEVLDRHGVRSVPELEAVHPGALRDEVIVPNVEESVALGRAITERTGHVVVVPGVFEARKQRWSQTEYMCLWLRLITQVVECVHLSPDWQYSNGGAVEYARAVLVRYRCVESRDRPMDVVDHEGHDVPLGVGVRMLLAAADDLTRRGHDASVLRHEAGRLAGLAATLAYGDSHEWRHATRFAPLTDCMDTIRAVEASGIPIAFNMR